LSERSLINIDSNTIVEGYAAFVESIQGYGLLEAYSLKPVLDGKTLMRELSLKPGPEIKIILDAVVEWQLASPENCQRKDALAMVTSRKEEFGIQ
jgi:tRNA nucleotidyltransferase (CCA-adding enzyme)